jgi:hypothetical protein
MNALAAALAINRQLSAGFRGLIAERHARRKWFQLRFGRAGHFDVLLANAAHLPSIVGLGWLAIHSARVAHASISASNLTHLPVPFFAFAFGFFGALCNFLESPPSKLPVGGNSPFLVGGKPL